MSASNVKWVRLGNYIKEFCAFNRDNSIKIVRSVSTIKEFKPTGAKVDKSELSKYKIVPPRYISYVQTTKNEKCFACAINLTNENLVVTSVNKVITSLDEQVLNNEFLFLLLSRRSFDRFAIFNSWGSAREVFQYEDLCNVQIPLPDIKVQQELVATYNGLKALAEQNEALIEPLSKACEAFIVDCKSKYPQVELGEYMIRGSKNTSNSITKVLGVAQNGFISPQKNPNESLRNYKIMSKNAICYAPPLYNIMSDAIQLYEFEEYAVCSPIYEVFHLKGNSILPHFLFIWLKRQEFKRYATYYALGVRQTFNYELMEQVKIPLPPIEVQQSIVNLYKCLEEAKKIASEAREKLKTLCPALVQRAANS